MLSSMQTLLVCSLFTLHKLSPSPALLAIVLMQHGSKTKDNKMDMGLEQQHKLEKS